VNAELLELRDSTRQVLGAEGLAAPEDRTWSLALELGWLLVAVPEAQAGLGQGLAGSCALQAELGRSLCTAPVLPAALALDAIVHAARDDRDDWIERLSTRELVTAPLAATALNVTGKQVLDGVAAAVPSADRATHVLVCSADAGCVALVPLQQRGVECVHRDTWDVTRRLFDLRFSGVALDPAWVLARGADAQALSRHLAVHRDLALAADAVGGADAMLAMTVEYLKTRRQFGRPLALFQALKHRCADLKTQVAAAEALLFDSVARIGELASEPRAGVLAQAARSLACAVYARVTEEALQLHGGIGMTAEHGCHLFLKRALLNQQLGRGDADDLDVADALLRAS
jgi:alkylation response protein AidB-like acyl-CoA dehydrogenase